MLHESQAYNTAVLCSPQWNCHRSPHHTVTVPLTVFPRLMPQLAGCTSHSPHLLCPSSRPPHPLATSRWSCVFMGLFLCWFIGWFLRFHTEMESHDVCLSLTSFTWCNTLSVRPYRHEWQGLILFCGCVHVYVCRHTRRPSVRCALSIISHPSAHRGCVHVLAVVKSAAVDTGACIFSS